MDPKTERRVERIRVLLRTRNDYLPQPKTTELSSMPGPAPGRLTKCLDCRSGRTKYGTECPVCHGEGWVPRRAGDIAYDDYTRERVVSEEDAKPRTMTMAELSVSISRLEAEELARQGRYEGEQFGWERARVARDRTGSYVELERALEELPQGSGRFLTLYYEGVICGPTADEVEAILVRDIERRMPRNIRIPDWAYDEETMRLVAQVKEMGKHLDAGEIGYRLGMSTRRVKELLGRKVAA